MKPMGKLEGYARLVMKMAKTELTTSGAVDPAVWLPDDTGKMNRIELGPFKHLLDSIRGKKILFSTIGAIVKKDNLPCVLYISEAWLGQQTDKGRAIGEKAFLAKADKSPAGFTDLITEGLITRTEVIMVTVQTPEGSLILRQPFERDSRNKSITFGPEEIEGADGNLMKLEGRVNFYGEQGEA